MERTDSRRRRVLSDSEKRACIQRQAVSGKTVVAFCREEGIALSSFHGWKRKFADKPVFVEMPVPLHSVAVEIIPASGDRIVTSSDCDPLWLAGLVRALGISC